MKQYELEASNIFYVSNFNVIGGVETFIYELAKKYKQYDIAVVYKTGHPNQIRRLMKYIKVHKYKDGYIKCKKFFCNYETDIIDKVDANEYTQIIHAMFKTNRIRPRINPKVNKYLAVSNAVAIEWEELTGIKAEVCRNPLAMEEQNNVLFFISATRLTQEKGKGRMEKLAKDLDKAGIEYLWYVFTNDDKAIDNPNIVFLKPRLNIRPIIESIKGKGYGVQLSDCEGDCYFTRECEMLGIPLICTPIPSFKEQGLEEGKNCYYMPFDMKDTKVERLLNIPKYDGYIGQDNWINNLVKDKSYYKEEDMKVKLRCIRSYFDVEKQKDMALGEEWTVDKKRADELINNPNMLVEVIEYIEEPKIEKAIVQPKTEKAIKPRKKK